MQRLGLYLYTRKVVQDFPTFRGAIRYARRAHLPIFWQGGERGWTVVRTRKYRGLAKWHKSVDR